MFRFRRDKAWSASYLYDGQPRHVPPVWAGTLWDLSLVIGTLAGGFMLLVAVTVLLSNAPALSARPRERPRISGYTAIQKSIFSTTGW